MTPQRWFAQVVRHPDLHGGDIKVAWRIAEAIELQSGAACLSHSEIGRELQISRAVVGVATARLAVLGFLSVSRRAGPEFRNVYHLALPPDDQQRGTP